MTRGLTYIVNPDLALAYVFDCTIEEEYVHESDVTDFPVENGPNIVDHVRRKPDTINLRIAQSNTPIHTQLDTRGGVVESLVGLDLAEITIHEADLNTQYRAEKFYAAMVGLKQSVSPVYVMTNLVRDVFSFYLPLTNEFRFYPRFWVLRSIKTKKDKDTGDIVEMSLGFKELFFVESRRAQLIEAVAGTEEEHAEPAKNANEKKPPFYSIGMKAFRWFVGAYDESAH